MDDVSALDRDRLVSFKIVVRVPMGSIPKSVFLTGNCLALGNGKADGVQLTANADGTFSTEIEVPKGDLRFNVTQGTWKTAEANAEGGDRGSRQLSVTAAETVVIVVIAWKGGAVTRNRQFGDSLGKFLSPLLPNGDDTSPAP